MMTTQMDDERGGDCCEDDSDGNWDNVLVVFIVLCFNVMALRGRWQLFELSKFVLLFFDNDIRLVVIF